MGYQVVSQEEICPGIEVEEDGTTFLENARKKAVEIFRRTGLPTIADDAGLCVVLMSEICFSFPLRDSCGY